VAALGLLATATCGGGGGADGSAALDGDGVRGVDGDTITLGAITVESGPMAAAGRAITAGNQAYFAALEEAGGLGGGGGDIAVEIAVVDGEDDPAGVAAAYDRLRGDVALFVQVTGFRAAGAALEPLAADDALAGTLAVDFPWSRHQNLVALGTPLSVGTFNALHWYVNAPGARTTACGLVGEGDYGAVAHDALAASADLLYLDLGPVIELGSGDAGVGHDGNEVAGAVDRLAAAECDVVVAATLPPATTAALAQASRTGLASVWLVPAPSAPALDDPEVATYAGEHVWLVGDGTWSGPGPGPSDGRDALEEARAAHASNVAPGDPWFLLGWLEARAAHQVLERAIDAGDLAPSGILAAANAPDDLTFDGLTSDLVFGAPEYREPPRTTVLTRPGPGGEEIELDGDDAGSAVSRFEVAVQELRQG
jgi:ABC-type branched-subunit amino acid transport system substrate-binding protein